MRSSIHVGRLFGIPLYINYTWFIIVVLVSASFATVTYPSQFPYWSEIAYWGAGALTALLLFTSVVMHELAHSLVSIARGTPVDAITLFIFGGVSSLSEEAKHPLDELFMTIAGPGISLLIGVTLGVPAVLGVGGGFLNALMRILGLMNLWLALFNLIPGFPLDGGRILRALIWGTTGDMRLATRVASAIGQGVAIVVIVSGFFVAFFLRDWSSGLWLAFVGWFLENAARQSYAQFLLREMLSTVTAGDLMETACPTIEGNPSVQDLLDQQILGEGRRCLLLTREQALIGMITLHTLKTVPPQRRPETYASDIMIPFERVSSVNANDSLLAVLRKMDQAEVNQLPVIQDGRLVGMVTRERVLRYIRSRVDEGL